MSTPDPAFTADAGLDQALALLRRRDHPVHALPEDLPELGVGEARTLALLAAPVLGRAADLGAPTALAHMDPSTPWITWAMALWNASLNQNLLHESVSPFATGEPWLRAVAVNPSVDIERLCRELIAAADRMG